LDEWHQQRGELGQVGRQPQPRQDYVDRSNFVRVFSDRPEPPVDRRIIRGFSDSEIEIRLPVENLQKNLDGRSRPAKAAELQAG
jgi:hypothetical protein